MLLQGGEYFGSTICVTDVNSDGLDDLLVGAPLNSIFNDGGVLYPDQGKVYVYLNHNEVSLIANINKHTKPKKIMLDEKPKKDEMKT